MVKGEKKKKIWKWVCVVLLKWLKEKSGLVHGLVVLRKKRRVLVGLKSQTKESDGVCLEKKKKNETNDGIFVS